MSEELKSESKFDELKSDCLIEILSRLSVESLSRCTCVSKGWMSIIRSPEFIAKHYDFHHHYNNSVLAVFKPGCSISILCAQNLTFRTAFKFRPAVVYDPPLYQIYHRDVINEFYVEGPCNGLFLINFVKAGFPNHNPVLLLWNPATREVFKLPLIDIDIVDNNNNNIVDHFSCCLTYGFGFDTVNRDYKVVGLYAVINNRIDYTVVCLYSLATNSWTRLYHAYDRISTQLDDVSHNIHPPYSFINGIPIQNDKGGYKYYVRAPCSHNGSTSSSNGRMHNWIAKHNPGYKYLLLSFDMVDEVLVHTPLPPPGVSAGEYGVGFLSHGSDHPCVFSFTNEQQQQQHLHIWLLQDYGPMGVWNKILDISVPESDWQTTMYAAILWNNNQNQNENQLVFNRGDKLFSFNMTTKQTTSLGIPGDAAVIAYTESLVPIAKSVRQQPPTINIIHHSNQQNDDDDDDDDSSSSSMDSAFLTPDITPFFHYDTVYIDMETDMEFGPRRHNEVDKLSNLPYCLREVNRPMVSNPCTF